MSTTRHIASACPHCGKLLDASTALGNAAVPKLGDISLCIRCGGWMEYDEKLRATLPTVSEADILLSLDDATRNRVVAVREKIRQLGRREKP